MPRSFRNLAAPLLQIAAKAGATAVANSFDKRDPFAAQGEILSRLVARGRDTRFGKDHGFPELTGLPFPAMYQRFRQLVPIRTYADFWRDYFGAGFSEQGGQKRLSLTDVTWPGQIPFFCETSGTTAPTKFIPFSSEMFAANKRAALDLTACYLRGNRASRLLHGRLLYMAGNTSLSDMGTGVRSGDMSAITLRHAPWYLKPFTAPDPELSALPWEEKLETLAQLLVAGSDIRAISGVPPWILLLLKRCTEKSGKTLAETLPNLELIIHGGTSMKPYRKEFDELFGPASPQYLELLPSSEAFMAFQLPGEEHMRFTPYYGVFFEFVPFEELDERGVPKPDAAAIPLEEVRAGVRYAVILSTCAGLWRYHIGDTIRFVSLDPLMIEFTGRDKFLDRFEEKVTQGEVEEAIAGVNGIGGVDVREFVVGPEIAERRHLWVLALRGESPLDDAQLAEELDRRLQSMNADYATFRNQGRIKAPLVVTTGEDAIYRWSKEVRGKLGGQSKIPHIDPTVDGEMIASLVYFAGRG
ncbi:MAG: GH3 auxin-responsive promoter family protein [Geobacter sp.]|nr:GH3 auxin-responsive promoter family protein [Geobacter sp.]